LSIDPVTTDSNTGGSFNRYSYANNNPYKYIDPDGRDPDSIFPLITPERSAAAAQHWANKQVATGNVLYAVPGVVATMLSQNMETVATAALMLKGGGAKAGTLPDSALVVRGGVNTAAQYAKASGSQIEANGTVSGVSVNSAAGKSVEALSKTIPNGQVGVTTVGMIREAGGSVQPKPTANNPDHCHVCGLTPQQGEKLFTPTQSNPSR
jgi:hypothetical protein